MCCEPDGPTGSEGVPVRPRTSSQRNATGDSVVAAGKHGSSAWSTMAGSYGLFQDSPGSIARQRAVDPVRACNNPYQWLLIHSDVPQSAPARESSFAGTLPEDLQIDGVGYLICEGRRTCVYRTKLYLARALRASSHHGCTPSATHPCPHPPPTTRSRARRNLRLPPFPSAGFSPGL